jgi:hypothetical protein
LDLRRRHGRPGAGHPDAVKRRASPIGITGTGLVMTGREERGAHPADPAWAPLRQDDRSFRKGTLGLQRAATALQPVAARCSPVSGGVSALVSGLAAVFGTFHHRSNGNRSVFIICADAWPGVFRFSQEEYTP